MVAQQEVLRGCEHALVAVEPDPEVADLDVLLEVVDSGKLLQALITMVQLTGFAQGKVNLLRNEDI